MSLLPQHLSFYAGDSKIATIQLANDSDGADFVPGSDYNLIFTAKDSLDDADSLALFQYVTGAGITHVGSAAEVVLHPEDTRPHGALKLYWDIQAENLLVAGDIRTVAIGTVSLKQDATRQTTTSVPIHTITPGVPYTGADGADGATTYAALTDAATVDLPTVNTPLADALALLAPLDSPAFPGFITVGGSVTAESVNAGTLTSTGDLGVWGDAGINGYLNVDGNIETTSGQFIGAGTGLNGTAADLTAGTVTTINGRLTAGANVTISGAGTAASPYNIAASGGSVTNATVNAAIATDTEATRTTLVGNSRPIVRLMSDASNSQRSGINPEIRIAILGDSTRNDFGLPYWYGRFGIGGKICTFADVADGYLSLAGGVTSTDNNALYSTTWTGCDYFNVPVAGTITYNDNRYQCNRFELWYFAEDTTATGVIEYEIDGSGTWVSVFQNSSVNVDNNLTGLTLTKVAGIIEDSGGLGHSRNYKLRYRGLTGNAKIVALGGYLSGGGTRPSGVTTMDMGKGGQFIEWTSDVPAGNFASALTGFAPHVVFFRMWEEHFGTDYQTDFSTIITRIKSALPTASIVVTGRHPTSDITSNFEVTSKETWLRDYCKTNDITFLPVTKSFPPYAEIAVGAARPLLSDGVHLSTSGRAYLNEVIRTQIPFLSSARPLWWIGPIGQQPTESYLQGVRGAVGKEFLLSGFSQKDFAFMGMSTSTGNNSGGFPAPGSGTGRLKDVSGYQHSGRLGFYNDGYLTGVIGTGRFWVGPGGTSTSSPGRESGPNKNINGGIVTQNPTTTTPSIRAGVIAGTTAATYAISVDIGASVSSDGTSTAGFFADGRAKIIIPTYAADADADADSALLSGQLYRTTAGARSVFQKP